MRLPDFTLSCFIFFAWDTKQNDLNCIKLSYLLLNFFYLLICIKFGETLPGWVPIYLRDFFFKSIFMELKLNILPFASNFALQNVLEKCLFFNLLIVLNVNNAKFNIGKKSRYLTNFWENLSDIVFCYLTQWLVFLNKSNRIRFLIK